MATNFVAKSAKFIPTFIRRTGVTQWIGGSQRRFKKIKWRRLVDIV